MIRHGGHVALRRSVAVAAAIVLGAGAALHVPALGYGAAGVPAREPEVRGAAAVPARGPQVRDAAAVPARGPQMPGAAGVPAREPQVLHVDDDADCGGLSPCYRSIGAAVAAAVDGDRVLIAAGLYTETVTASGLGLSFEGPGAGAASEPDDPSRHAVWTGADPASAALNVDAASIAVTRTLVAGLRFRGGAAGLRFVGVTAPEVRGNSFDAIDGTAVELHLGHAPVGGLVAEITGNRVTRAAASAIVVRPLPGAAGAAVRLSGNVVTEARGAGVLVDTGGGGNAVVETSPPSLGGVTIVGDRVLGAGRGTPGGRGAIVIVGGSGTVGPVSVAGVEVRDSATDGLVIERPGSSVAITGSILADSAGAGLALQDVAHLRLARSTVVRNDVGVRVVEADRPPAAPDLSLGGAPADGNLIAGNRNSAVRLVNATGSQAATSDVAATYNNWGTAWAAAVEDSIVHRADDVLLGLVSYLPILGAPASADASAQPESLPADGTSTSVIRLAARDGSGRPAADDALAAFATDAGRLDGGGSRSEVEADPSVRRIGEWGEFASGPFGPFRGSGYLRSASAGAALAWTFDAPALAMRYGQVTSAAATFRVDVDGVHVGTYGTSGPERAWTSRLLAGGLGPGRHVVTVTAVAGELNVDRLVAGTTTPGGVATATLRAGSAVGFGHVIGWALGASGEVSDTVDVPFIVGRPSRMSLSADAASLPVGGVTTTVTVSVRDDQGRPVSDGTPVRLSTSLGTIAPVDGETVAGVVRAVLTSSSRVGTATVRAESGAAYATATVSIVPGPPATLSIEGRPASLAANGRARASVYIAVSDAHGNPSADGTVVSLLATLGSVEPVTVTTRAGTSRASFLAGPTAGLAVINARSGSAAASTTIELVATDLRLTKTVEPESSVVPGEPVTFTLAFENVGTGTVHDVVLDDVLPTGLISPVVRTPPRLQLDRLVDRPLGFRIARLEPGEGGRVVVSMRVDTSLMWGNRRVVTNRATIASDAAEDRTPSDNAAAADVVVVPGAVYAVTVEAPERLPVGGATGVVRALLADRFGNPAGDGTAVAFAADDGMLEPQLAFTVGGVASATFTTGSRAGEVVVRAVTLDERAGTARVLVVPGPPHRLILDASRREMAVGGATAVLTATMADQYGNGTPGITLTFETDAGLVTPPSATTDARGVATATLRSAVRAGTARITVRDGSLTAGTTVGFHAGPPHDLALRLEPPRTRTGGSTRAVARVTDAFGNPVAGEHVAFETTIGRLASPLGRTGADGEAGVTLWTSAPGTGAVRAALGDLGDQRTLVVEGGMAWLPFAYRSPSPPRPAR